MKRLVVISLAMFCAIQVFRPRHEVPKIDPQKDFASDPRVPPEVKAIVQSACYDCHSYGTVWPWYSHVAPVSWLLNRHVQHGRRKLNFSEWMESRKSSDPAEKGNVEIQKICDVVKSGNMPLFAYRLMHSEARLSNRKVEAICEWAKRSQASVGRHSR